MDANEALRLQKENNFVILDVRPEAEFKEVSRVFFSSSLEQPMKCYILFPLFGVGPSTRGH